MWGTWGISVDGLGRGCLLGIRAPCPSSSLWLLEGGGKQTHCRTSLDSRGRACRDHSVVVMVTSWAASLWPHYLLCLPLATRAGTGQYIQQGRLHKFSPCLCLLLGGLASGHSAQTHLLCGGCILGQRLCVLPAHWGHHRWCARQEAHPVCVEELEDEVRWGLSAQGPWHGTTPAPPPASLCLIPLW